MNGILKHTLHELMGNRSIVGEEIEKKASINLQGCFTSHFMNDKYDHIHTSQVICLSVTVCPVPSFFQFVYFCYPK